MSTATPPVQAVLTKLRRVRPKLSGGYLASCPVPTHGKGNGDRNPSLSIEENDRGDALVNCLSGRSTDDVLQAIGMVKADLFADSGRLASTARPTFGGKPVRPGRCAPTGEVGPSTWKPLEHSNTGTKSPESQGNDVRTGGRPRFKHGSYTGPFTPTLTLQELADAKQLPVDHLKAKGCSDVKYDGGHAVRVVYPKPDGTAGPVRYRVSLEKPPQGGDRFRWKSGSKVQMIGLDHLEAARGTGYIVLVEGETDYFTLAYNGIPAAGVPGANNFRDDRDGPHLAGIETVYAVIEPDQGGETFRKKLGESSIRERVRFIDLSFHGVKDVNALWCDDHARFRERFEEARANATPWTDFDTQAREAVELRARGERIDGAALLDSVAAFLARFVSYPSDHARTAHALWIAHTHMMDAWDTTPRLAFLSPEPASGKTRARDYRTGGTTANRSGEHECRRAVSPGGQ